ncbi:uracil-DNA glycosylase family protein [Geothrix sp. SG200]|uniref:uracil-DNA glycosylase family protein n=1 Tax=Geothrix sp. SG200 TaxID=2922865 RepID=UPI001FAD3701|nr:uracil-DNA glycosylase family protein [Geothrix sp. SG200]
MVRKARQVISELLAEKQRIVTQFHPLVADTGNRIEDLIDGTAVFPGGSGLWRGPGFHGALPENFPDSPIMIIGHNFDSETGYKNSKIRGGELQAPHTFWGVLLAYLKSAELSPFDCFFTNVLMGLKPGSATGPMPSSKIFESQCLQFLVKQIQTVRPRFIITLGVDAYKRVDKAPLSVSLHSAMHPSAREFKPLITRDHRINEQGQAIKNSLRRYGLGFQ